jgi:hypothetical protein
MAFTLIAPLRVSTYGKNLEFWALGIGNWGLGFNDYLCPMPHAPCPMDAPCPNVSLWGRKERRADRCKPG